MGGEEFRRALDETGPTAAPAGIDTDAVVARGRRAVRVRRVRTSAVAAACVLAVAVPAGFGFLGSGPDDGRDIVNPPTSGPEPGKTMSRRAAGEECAALAADWAADKDVDEGRAQGLSAKAFTSSPDGTTVLVSNKRLSWSCNLAPDREVSVAEPALATGVVVGPGAGFEPMLLFQVAVTEASDGSGDVVWAGGRIPELLTGPDPARHRNSRVPGDGLSEVRRIEYRFPDGDTEAAVMDRETGYWVMQYVPPEQFTRPLTFDSFPISVTVFPVDEEAAQFRLSLVWGQDTCHQAGPCLTE